MKNDKEFKVAEQGYWLGNASCLTFVNAKLMGESSSTRSADISVSIDIEPYKHWCDTTHDSDGHDEYCYYDEIDREKSIEIAKHFKLTVGDLK